jgi:CDP-4-dehydro-6-deoxyglucose reductase, E1
MSYDYPLVSTTWDDREIKAIENVVKSGHFTMGEKVNLFEQQFAKYVGSKYCVMVNSGSSANLIMIAALFYRENNKLSRGDEVIVPAVSWGTTYSPLFQYGLKMRFVDIDIETLNFDLEKLEASITDNTKAIMAVNLLGNPNNYSAINRIIANRDILLLEDNCEALGAMFNNKKTGTIGVMGSFSSFFSHHISTMEGGVVVTDNEELYQIMLSLRAHGWTRDLPKENYVTKRKSDNNFEESYKFVLPGYNVRPLEIEAAIGIEQLLKLPNLVDQRRLNGIRFKKIMNSHPDILIQKEIGESSWFGFSLVIKPGSRISREELSEKLENIGFEHRPIVGGNFTKNPVMQYYNTEIPDSLKNAEYIDKQGLFIGNHHHPMDSAFEKLEQGLAF